MKLPPDGGASRKGNFVRIVPLDPAYKVGLAGHVPVKNLKLFPNATPRLCP
jgi:hypothetical protein